MELTTKTSTMEMERKADTTEEAIDSVFMHEIEKDLKDRDNH